MTLKELPIGKSATLTVVGGEGALRQHFLDMGLIPGADVTMVKYAPMGDPVELRIHSYELTLRLADAEKIEITDVRDEIKIKNQIPKEKIDHPGLGEGGKYHEKADENPLPDGTTLTFALAGNQNCGKTTLFNQLTGANQHVGNFPGVTVDRKDGVIKEHSDTLVTDLPGIYSMSPYSSEEIVTRNFVLNEHPKGIINIVDATNIERNLYLTMQLMELDIPMVLALNMMDEVRDNGGSILVNEMEQELGIPVIPISAAKNEGIGELIEHAVHVAKYQESPGRQDFCDADDHGGAVHRCLHGIMHLIEDHAKKADIPVRFAACKLAEGDELILEQLKLDENEKQLLEHIVKQMEQERGLDRSAAIADMRFTFIEKICDATVVKPKESKEHLRSAKMDKILTGKYTAIPCFVAIMAAVFWLTFNVIGAALSNLLDMGISALTNLVDGALTSWNVNSVIHSLVIDGIFNGVGSVLSFLPVIVTLFFFLSILEDSGYMARVAFIMDKIMRKMGLSGKAFIPMIVGFGCSVPAIMTARTLESEKDRKLTALLIPLMSCNARLPVYSIFAAVFFPKYVGLVVASLYFLGIVLAFILGVIFKHTIFKNEEEPLLIELPEYKLPSLKNLLNQLYEKSKSFIIKAGTLIFAMSIVLWFLSNFNFTGMTDVNNSILSSIGGFIAPIFKPLGFGNWQASVSLLTGLIAKETVVSSMGVIFGGNLQTLLPLHFTALSALSFMVFVLLYTPCITVVGTMKKEFGTKMTLFSVAYQLILAWIVSFLVFNIGSLFF